MRLVPTTICLLASLTSCNSTGTPPTPRSSATQSSMTILVGQRMLDEDDWAPLDEPTVFGVEFDSYGPYDPVGFEIGFSYAEDSGNVSAVDVDSEIWELYAGPRKTFSLAEDRLHPYISAGASWSNAELQSGSGSIDDDALGFYLRAGVYYTIGDGFNLGLDYRKLLGADFEESGLKADGDFDQVSVGIGYSF